MIGAKICDDIDCNSEQWRELEAHLSTCQACAEEYVNAKWTVAFVQEHKFEFSRALQTTVDKQDALDNGWQAIEAKIDRIETRAKQRTQLYRLAWKASAIAACVAIGIAIGFTLSKTPERPAPQQVAAAPISDVKIELLLDDGSAVVPVGIEVRTSIDELKTLVINDKHRVVLNSDTALTIQSLIENGYLGCLVKLSFGEIFAHVNRAGNPFVVGTAHGKAVITGTILDVKVTDNSTKLVVTEGTVQFGSGKGAVEVTVGQMPEIVAQLAPTEPILCNAAELTAWATADKPKTALAKIEPWLDSYGLDNLWSTIDSGPVKLESINYVDWVEIKRDWFQQQFPWIFDLRDALANEGFETDYPELLVKSGDIWQFVCSQVSPSRIPVLKLDSLPKTTSQYGFNEPSLLEKGFPVKSAIDNYPAEKHRFTNIEASERWLSYFEQARKRSKELDSETLLYGKFKKTSCNR